MTTYSFITRIQVNDQPVALYLLSGVHAGQALFLDHVAILIDDDLYFEKAGSGDNTPFRWILLRA